MEGHGRHRVASDHRVLRPARFGGDESPALLLSKQTAESSDRGITDVGFGVAQALPVLVLSFQTPEGSTILLEQPETRLHPSAQAGLADALLDARRRRNIQFLVESHSEHLLRRSQRRVSDETLAH